MAQMAGLTLSPLPGETLPSVLAREALLHADYIGRKTVRKQLGYLSSPSHLLPTGISRLRWSSTTPEEFIYRHTGYPYFVVFMRPARRRAAREKILFGQGSALKMIVGLPAGRLGAVEQYRYCDRCRHEDLCSYGVAYWHREHQLPGVLLCQAHNCMLIEHSNLGFGGVHRHLFLPPQTELGGSRIDVPSVSEEATSRLGAIADFSTALLADTSIIIEPALLMRTYREMFLRTEMRDREANISFKRLATAVRRWMEPLSELDPFRMLYRRAGSESGWVAALVHQSRSSIHPLKHIVYACAVFGNYGRFISAYSQLPLPLERATPRRCSPPLESISRALREGAKPTAVARKYNVSVHYVQRIAHNLNIVVNRRPKILSAAKEDELSRRLRRGLAVKSVAQKSRVSVCTVYRVIQFDAQLKHDWKTAYVARNGASSCK